MANNKLKDTNTKNRAHYDLNDLKDIFIYYVGYKVPYSAKSLPFIKQMGILKIKMEIYI